MFPYIPNQPAYNKRLRGAQGLLRSVIRVLAEVSPSWFDDLWITDATPRALRHVPGNREALGPSG